MGKEGKAAKGKQREGDGRRLEGHQGGWNGAEQKRGLP